MKKLLNYGETEDELSIFRGMRLRFPGSYPHEAWLEVLVYDPQEAGRGMGLLVMTGRKAGLPLVVLPFESEGPHHRAICTKWLVRNFEEWVYDAPIDEVFVFDHLAPPSRPLDA